MPEADSKGSSKLKQQQKLQNFDYPQHLRDDSIDLYEVLITIWKWKWLIVIVTVVAVLVAYIYALRLQSIYKAETLLLPPKAKDFQSLNLAGIKELAIYELPISIPHGLHGSWVNK